jgi:hypothetical protein
LLVGEAGLTLIPGLVQPDDETQTREGVRTDSGKMSDVFDARGGKDWRGQEQSQESCE